MALDDKIGALRTKALMRWTGTRAARQSRRAGETLAVSVRALPGPGSPPAAEETGNGRWHRRDRCVTNPVR